MTKPFRAAVLWGDGSTTWKHFDSRERAIAYKPDTEWLGFPRVDEVQERVAGKWFTISKDDNNNKEGE